MGFASMTAVSLQADFLTLTALTVSFVRLTALFRLLTLPATQTKLQP
jgi:Tfp pilus assembly protein PilN